MEEYNLISNRDIVVVGLQPWDVEIGSNCKNIALEFSKHNRVLYVNSPLDRITFMRHKSDPRVKKRINVLKRKEEAIVKIGGNLWNYYPDKMIESINWIKNQGIFNNLNRYNNKIFAASIKKAVKQLGFSNILLFNDNDIFRSFYLKDYLQPDKSIYYSRDFLLAVDYWRTHGLKLEPEIIAKSDCCVANSTYLTNYCKQYNSNSFYVGQGCELDIFLEHKSHRKPADIELFKSPVIGYVGALQSIRIDLDILKHIAQHRPSWNIVLVGPEDEQFKKGELHSIKNIHFLGAKQPADLPAYINAFDVCLNPQLVNAVTIGNYPRKIDEYLAMGKPVVATRTEAMSIFEAHTYLGNSKEEYITLIEKALAENSATLVSERKLFATEHSWENSVKDIYAAVNKVSR
ncbi:glycosyltransferase family 1 protein [Panacibacter ginsenosidivorans]|uniref:Glycosyltransferase family 1 protein n=1 Tax=Panacibacter ginsenosidivorans TaxID=1813871 RepID=A0A5B8V624_9BACT|nr:glycosyltransferase [Panacibacter ginsenosidivorans]QEC66639.1 glycosyltransferase family 1 protein [Panacibacter ginsenosidivorans]